MDGTEPLGRSAAPSSATSRSSSSAPTSPAPTASRSCSSPRRTRSCAGRRRPGRHRRRRWRGRARPPGSTSPSGRRPAQHRQPAPDPRRRARPGAATAINFHDGPLPGYAGLNVTTWALLAGEREHAITWHLMTSDVDGGEIVAAEHFPIADDETAFSLNARCYEAALASFPRDRRRARRRATSQTPPQPDGEHRMFMRHDRPARAARPGRAGRRARRAPCARSTSATACATRIGVVRWVLGDDVVRRRGGAATADAVGGAAPGTLVARRRRRAPRIATADGDLVDHGGQHARRARRSTSPTSLARHGLARRRRRRRRRPPTLVDGDRRRSSRRCRATSASGSTGCAASSRPPPPAGVDRRHAAAASTSPGRAPTTRRSLAAVAAWLARVDGRDRVSLRRHRRRGRARRSTALGAARPRPASPCVELADERARSPTSCAAAGGRAGERRPPPAAAARRDRPRPAHARATVAGRRSLVELGADAGATAARRGRRCASPSAPATSRVDAAADRRSRRASTGSPSSSATLLARRRRRPVDRRRRAAAARRRPSWRCSTRSTTPTLDHDRTATIDGLFHAQVARTPDAPALSFGARTLTYAELRARGRARSPRRLAAAGVGRGDRVGIAVPARRRHGRRRARHARPRRGLPAARPDLPDRAPRASWSTTPASPCSLATGGDARPSSAGPASRSSTRPRPADGAAAAPPARRPRPGRPRLRHLHVGLDRPAEGRDARAPPGRQLLRRHGPGHRPRPARRRGWP